MSALMARPRTWIVVIALLGLAACGGSGGGGGSGGAPARPTTSARLQIVEPTANQVTGPNVAVKLNLMGAQVVDRTTGPLTPDEGHLHLSVDGQLVSMAYGADQELKDLTPGPHTVQAEFVAVDHAPFANRVVAATLFTVQ